MLTTPRTWWNRPLRYPNLALNPFVGSETMLRLSIMLDNLVAKCFILFGMNVWERLERIERMRMAEEKKSQRFQ